MCGLEAVCRILALRLSHIIATPPFSVIFHMFTKASKYSAVTQMQPLWGGGCVVFSFCQYSFFSALYVHRSQYY